ncbi:MAG: hypothetical protein QOE04_3838 [Mycobacterium sp.]|jgi:hypothetical protein|nr:hypothetical protein [Mycobacterium sp.]
MTFKLTYSDGQETDYDDDTAWEVDDGVLKMGRKEGDWTVLVSPSHWAVIEVGGASLHKDDEDDGGGDDDDEAAGDDDSDEAKNEGKKDDKKDDKSDD